MRWLGHHRLNEHEFEQALGDGVGQGDLVCCSLTESDTTEWLNNNDLASLSCRQALFLAIL